MVILMFMGMYNHTVDTKGRLIVPAKFRDELGSHFVITRGLDGCLSIYGMDEWKKLEEKLAALPMTNPNARKFSRFMIAGAAECELDKMGRILIPQALRQSANIRKDVVLSGAINRIEVWDEEKWNEMNAFSDEDMNEIAAGLEGLGI